ncbi:MAG: hypothetical protein IPJ69_06740 [Deltaproteobacteria bacterium]|nr:MAG: hypothetical protein IPJ69_06740 [Deltaproteobacteria bacterium]
MPYLSTVPSLSSRFPLLPEMVRIPGGIGVVGSSTLHEKFHNCPPRLVRVDEFYLAETDVSLALQGDLEEPKISLRDAYFKFQATSIGYRQLADWESQYRKSEVYDVPNPHSKPASFSFRKGLELVGQLTRETGIAFGIPYEDEWEYAARPPYYLRKFMDSMGLNDMNQLQEWLVNGGGKERIENIIPLEGGQSLTLGAQILVKPQSKNFVRTLEAAGDGVFFCVYGTQSGGLNHQEAYYAQNERGSLKYGPPNGRGLFNMTGGMWEWCVDTDKKGNLTGVRRGGGWEENNHARLYAAYSDKLSPDEETVAEGSIRLACKKLY